jgi:hypothetical protein
MTLSKTFAVATILVGSLSAACGSSTVSNNPPGNDAGNGNGFSGSARATESDIPIDTGDFEPPVAAGVADDDIPF